MTATDGLPREELPAGMYVLQLLAAAAGFDAWAPAVKRELLALAYEPLGITGVDQATIGERERLLARALGVVITRLEQAGLVRVG